MHTHIIDTQHTCAHIHVYTHTRVHTYIHTCMYVHTQIYTYIKRVKKKMYISIKCTKFIVCKLKAQYLLSLLLHTVMQLICVRDPGGLFAVIQSLKTLSLSLHEHYPTNIQNISFLSNHLLSLQHPPPWSTKKGVILIKIK